MADDPATLVHSPTEGQTLEQYLQNFTDAEIQQIFRTPELLMRLCTFLQENFRNLEQIEDSLERLWNIVKRVNNFDRLLKYIRRLEPKRKTLLETLDKSAQEIQKVSTLCTVGRLAGSAVDIAGTVGGLMLRDASPGYANLAFRAATAFGLMGLASTVSEMRILKNTLDDLMKLIDQDQQLFAPIQRWYRQTSEIEEAMQAVFQFDISNDVISDFTDNVDTELTPVRLLATLMKSMAEQDISRARDVGQIQLLINFTMNPASQDWLEWMILSRHPVFLDITRIMLQLQHSPLRFALCQSIPALAIADQSIESFPVWGRIGLNMVSIIDSVYSLRSSQIPSIAREMRRLRRHLRSEMASLQRISDFVNIRRKREQSE